MVGDIQEKTFNQQFTIPSELTLHSTSGGPRLKMFPISEFENLHKKTETFQNLTLDKDNNPLAHLHEDGYDIEIDFFPSEESITVFNLRGKQVLYNGRTRTLSCDNLSLQLDPVNGMISLRILIDRASIEIYGNKGVVYIPRFFVPEHQNRSYSATCTLGENVVQSLNIHQLKSIWESSESP
jgi:sucrose-6-phosphate hydrolase SacC (GH32 family)